MHGEELTLEHVKRLHTLARNAWNEHKVTCQRCQQNRYCERSVDLYCVAVKWTAKVVQVKASMQSENERMVKRIMHKADMEGWFSGESEQT